MVRMAMSANLSKVGRLYIMEIRTKPYEVCHIFRFKPLPGKSSQENIFVPGWEGVDQYYQILPNLTMMYSRLKAMFGRDELNTALEYKFQYLSQILCWFLLTTRVDVPLALMESSSSIMEYPGWSTTTLYILNQYFWNRTAIHWLCSQTFVVEECNATEPFSTESVNFRIILL